MGFAYGYVAAHVMTKQSFTFSSSVTTCYFDAAFSTLNELVDADRMVIVTDENVFNRNRAKFEGLKTIVVKAGEEFKTQSTVDSIIQQLIAFSADRKSTIVGVGGGVVTDIAGYAASVYMRGLPFGFAPTSLLAMVDASVGGKNGVDVGPYKNLVGIIRQPKFLLYDSAFLQTLPHAEWVNGFAEIIKHACIKNAEMFADLERSDIGFFKKNTAAMNDLIMKNVKIKSDVVMNDEFEQGERRLLNFGHTWGHAIETQLKIPHGHAVAIGMVMAARLSQHLTGFDGTQRLIKLLQQYELPVSADVDEGETFRLLKMDKKKDSASMNYVLLSGIGEAVVRKLSIDELEKMIINAGSYSAG